MAAAPISLKPSLVEPAFDTTVHDDAMRVDPETASKLYARIEIDVAALAEHNGHRKRLGVRNFKPNAGLIWQFDGQVYPLDSAAHKGALMPGERIWVPLLIAQYGVKQNSHWHYLLDQAGNVIDRYDFHREQVPLIRIIEIRDPGDFSAVVDVPKPALAHCAYCAEQIEPADLGNHMRQNHLREMTADLEAVEADQRAAAGSEASRKVREWADRQTGKGAPAE